MYGVAVYMYEAAEYSTCDSLQNGINFGKHFRSTYSVLYLNWCLFIPIALLIGMKASCSDVFSVFYTPLLM